MFILKPTQLLLRFQQGNAKLADFIHFFSLPAGHSCPAANLCLAKAKEREDGSWYVEDGPNMDFRCFAASDEARYKNVRAIRWHNFNMLRKLKKDAMVELINNSLPRMVQVVRVHESGDYFNQDYFDAWMEVARMNPTVRFYSYIKSVNYWVARLGEIPENFYLTASLGGKYDHLVYEYGLKNVTVVKTDEEAAALGLEVDHDDSHAYDGVANFALTVHNAQKKGTDWAKASYANSKKKREKKAVMLAMAA